MLKKKKICILCGHHGRGTGASGNNIDEYIENSWVSCALMNRLADLGYDVEILMVQNVNLHEFEDDYKMRRRQEAMRLTKADLFVSIHHNSFGDKDVSGAELYYFDVLSEPLAAAVGACMEDELGMKWRGCKRYKWAVISEAMRLERPCILVEGGFISNLNDALRIGHVSWPDRFAKAIADGIERYYLDI